MDIDFVSTLTPFHDRLGPMGCVFVASFLQSITGFGLMLTASPLMMIFYDAKLTVQILIYIGLFSNFIQSIMLWRTAKYDLIFFLILGAVCGQPFGFLLFNYVSSELLKIFISVIILCFLVVSHFSHLTFSQKPQNAFIAGLFSGIMATSVSMAGLALIIYFANAQLSRVELRSTCVLYFCLVQLCSMAIFCLNGGTNMTAAGKEFFYMLPGLFAGLFLGQIAFKHTSAKFFRFLLSAMLYFICFQSLYTALIK